VPAAYHLYDALQPGYFAECLLSGWGPLSSEVESLSGMDLSTGVGYEPKALTGLGIKRQYLARVDFNTTESSELAQTLRLLARNAYLPIFKGALKDEPLADGKAARLFLGNEIRFLMVQRLTGLRFNEAVYALGDSQAGPVRCGMTWQHGGTARFVHKGQSAAGADATGFDSSIVLFVFQLVRGVRYSLLARMLALFGYSSMWLSVMRGINHALLYALVFIPGGDIYQLIGKQLSGQADTLVDNSLITALLLIAAWLAWCERRGLGARVALEQWALCAAFGDDVMLGSSLSGDDRPPLRWFVDFYTNCGMALEFDNEWGPVQLASFISYTPSGVWRGVPYAVPVGDRGLARLAIGKRGGSAKDTIGRLLGLYVAHWMQPRWTLLILSCIRDVCLSSGLPFPKLNRDADLYRLHTGLEYTAVLGEDRAAKIYQPFINEVKLDFSDTSPGVW